MSKLTKKDVEHVASLAKLSISDKELEKYLKQLDEIVNYIGELNEVDTESTEPTSQTTGLENIFRPDELKPQQSLSDEEALAGTEETHNGYFKVEAVLTERTDK
ncbi:MAG: Aspartyl/glutamyl-tRNA(Asn/Gln) amidotransferase subunit C [Candidatus Woesebacteria bacterium GW2011_GWA2_44_33]|uniref:Aspartyl/glutamyl-tRNA(Asn/Gln) amidotransferase subunit C n=3 Tax=Microgenomates group TaxID=1794810 RepID=A0A0G1QFF9_9BACT|nr:MAG: Aspartyl/glutamyl-tRNA(Asn/Gln) amidotransferase subunit C [Candidatus Woesebacteria bacterium GW2011_GWA2_44_33]KKT66389.1 MAG: Aspartyl/glutamyl-tRNA(Asn/Gln) amidotransferase subunit C [Candidatus Curtissbacteria bacterium GW2011_GWC1_44_33]KKU16498.1 MAG: Aspartyl/glutamyl-tRNA(Asn/Gln) amidotransferase subunit C [Candidatus Woesebacteria bacterium GW2011_GWC2_45_9]